MLMMIALFTIGMPSCDGPDYAAFRGIQIADFYDVTTNNFIPPPASISGDSMILLIQPQIDFFTQFSMKGTMDQVWAFSPPQPTMANEITDIRIFSDQQMYGIPAGQNLSGNLSFGTASNVKLPLPVFLSDFLKKGSEFYYEETIFVFFNTKPASGTYHFVIELEDNNGHVFTATTSQLTWQ